MEITILPLSGSALNELINNDYLSTDHVSKFNEILAKYTSFRPREVLLMWNLPDMVITPVEQNEKHIQILPSEASARVTHWICTYYDGTIIHVYDSLNCNQSFNISKDQFNFLHCLFPYNPKIIYEPVQQQKNRLDCGVYAIAFAVCIAFGLDPSKQTFEVALMRKHLQLIFDKRQLFPFPVVISDNNGKEMKSRLENEKLYYKNKRFEETEEERINRLEIKRTNYKRKLSQETDEERNIRLEKKRLYNKNRHSHETGNERNIRLEKKRLYNKNRHSQETDEERNARLEKMRTRAKERRLEQHIEKVSANSKHLEDTLHLISWENAAFYYNPSILYQQDPDVLIGNMSIVCFHCKALKWKDESSGICCNNRKIKLEPLRDPPEPLKGLLNGTDSRTKLFMKSIRNYNSAFQMTSFGATNIVSEGGYMPTFKVQGQVYHLIGSLLPDNNQEPQYLQLYFTGDINQTTLRSKNHPGLDVDIIKDLQKMLHLENSYVKSFKTALEQNTNTENLNIVIRADKVPTQDHRGRYNAPLYNEVAVLIVGQDFEKRDIILRAKDNTLQRISEIHRSYDPLQYPLMFPYGEDGYHITLKQFMSQKTVSAMSFYAYRIMVRENKVNYLHYFRQLLNQYLVDMYAKIESERLAFIRNNQKKLRVDEYIHLRDAINKDGNVQNLGQLVILPSSFTGSPRYMHEKTQDAMTYVRKYGRPDLFITFTTNPKWPEIKEHLLDGQKAHDRHDIVSRVFHLKVKKLMYLLTKEKIFGNTLCYMYSIEWQKRGLPHVHILLWLEKKISPNQIDSFISAEIPNKNEDPLLFLTIQSNMIHGPCGSINPRSPCMKDNVCSKRYPRRFVSETITGQDGYPTYKRRSPQDGGSIAQIKVGRVDVTIDNRWVVPYCPLLCKIFNAHINVEFCNSVKSIKYVCKYVNKGTDQATFTIIGKENDEVYQYQSGRYISSSEAVWRILAFPIHERYPPVFPLSVHLENGQRIYFTASNILARVNEPPATTLTGFFNLCAKDDFARTLLYNEVPSFYTWNGKTFNKRKQGAPVVGFSDIRKSNAIGRVYAVHPNNAECYYLRLLLHNIRGPTSFDQLKCIYGKQHPTFQSACYALGLLESDSHWNTTLEEASLSDSPQMLRDLFVVMLAFCNVSNPCELWQQHKCSFAEDILRREQRLFPEINVTFTDLMFNEALIILENKLQSICGKSLKDYGFSVPQLNNVALNTVYSRETSYDINKFQTYVKDNECLLVAEQKKAYDEVLQSVFMNEGKLFFLDAPGGTGKTFVVNLLLAKIRLHRKIAIAVASSGIAATLLEGGKTAHSAFKLPLNLIYNETPICNIKKGTPAAQLLSECAIIIWDECTMSHKGAVEALNRTLMDVRNNDHLMGGATILFSGDFRQTIPVIPRGTRADEIRASLRSSFIWSKIKIVTLTVNMRVYLHNDLSAGDFSNLLLKIGNGEIAENSNGYINIPKDLGNIVNSIEELVDKIYPDLPNLHLRSDIWLCERAILSPKNDSSDEINNYLLNRMHGEPTYYHSIDSVLEQEEAVHYPIEFLNSLTVPGLAPHKLCLKVGTPIILLRNLNAPKLCNGTRLKVVALQSNLIEASILTGCAKGENVFIPRIPMIPSDYTITFKRLQFPIKVCFALTINKAQGQTLSIAGLDLRTPCFSHGQFYVACSRVSKSNNLFILCPSGSTKNVVYKEALT